MNRNPDPRRPFHYHRQVTRLVVDRDALVRGPCRLEAVLALVPVVPQSSPAQTDALLYYGVFNCYFERFKFYKNVHPRLDLEFCLACVFVICVQLLLLDR